MTEIKVIVTGPEEAYDYEAEFWRGNELIGVTVLHDGRLHLRMHSSDLAHDLDQPSGLRTPDERAALEPPGADPPDAAPVRATVQGLP